MLDRVVPSQAREGSAETSGGGSTLEPALLQHGHTASTAARGRTGSQLDAQPPLAATAATSRATSDGPGTADIAAHDTWRRRRTCGWSGVRAAAAGAAESPRHRRPATPLGVTSVDPWADAPRRHDAARRRRRSGSSMLVAGIAVGDRAAAYRRRRLPAREPPRPRRDVPAGVHVEDGDRLLDPRHLVHPDQEVPASRRPSLRSRALPAPHPRCSAFLWLLAFISGRVTLSAGRPQRAAHPPRRREHRRAAGEHRSGSPTRVSRRSRSSRSPSSSASCSRSSSSARCCGRTQTSTQQLSRLSSAGSWSPSPPSTNDSRARTSSTTSRAGYRSSSSTGRSTRTSARAG